MSLFGAQPKAASSKALVEFRAGKMRMETPGSKLVTPDKRKGLVQIEKGEDSLMHFKWKDRGSGKIEDDLIIFPDDIEFSRVSQCTTGRVYVLKFKSSSSRRMFFWMQEPKEDKDEEFCKKVNDYLNKPPSARTGTHRGHHGDEGALPGLEGLEGAGMDLATLGDSELQGMLGNMDQQQLMQLLGGQLNSIGGGSGGMFSDALSSGVESVSTPISASQASSDLTRAPSKPKVTNSTSNLSKKKDEQGGSVQLSDLQSILSGIKVPEKETTPPVDLSVGITSQAISPLLNNPDFVKKMKELLPSLTEEEDLTTELTSTITSPQFQQALKLFCSGLQSGQLAPLIKEFSLGEDATAAAAAGDMEAFIKAVEKKENTKEESTEDDASMKDAE